MRRNMGNAGGALRGLEMAAAMSGREMPTLPQQASFPINSRQQWMHERQVGGPLAELPFNKWRAL